MRQILEKNGVAGGSASDIRADKAAHHSDEIKRRISAREGVSDIARDLGIAPSIVLRLADGTKPPSLQVENRLFDYDAMIADYRTGAFTERVLGEKYSTTPTNIHRVLQTYAPDALEDQIARRRQDIPAEIRSLSPQVRKKFDTTALVKIVEESVETFAELGERLGVAPNYLHKLWTKAGRKGREGLPARRGRKRGFDADAMIADYLTGAYTQRQLAQKYNVSQGAISAAWTQFAPPGVNPTGRGRPRKVRA